MKPFFRYAKHLLCALSLMLAAGAICPTPARSALVYKNYVVTQDNGVDILCAPYVVKPGDWVLKIFKLRGEISRENFGRFLRIFRRLNPHVHEIDLIRPGQQIFIPLKELPSGSLAGQSSGLVTIPFVEFGRKSLRNTKGATRYRVQKGDCVSKLIAARFGPYGSTEYKKGLRQLKQLNPSLNNLELIYVNQVLFLPTPARGSIPPVLASAKTVRTLSARNAALPERVGGKEAPHDTADTNDTLTGAANILGGSLQTRGSYIVPGKDGEKDLSIDLKRAPLMEMPDGSRILFPMGTPIPKPLFASLAARLPNLRQVPLPKRPTLAQIVTDVLQSKSRGSKKAAILQQTIDGVRFDIRAQWILDGPNTDIDPTRHICITFIDSPKQRTAPAIRGFLDDHGIRIRDIYKDGRPASLGSGALTPSQQTPSMTTIHDSLDQRVFVSRLAKAVGYSFIPNAAITFPYAGIQVKAISNLLTNRQGTPLFVDFGELFGDAFDAIRQSGFQIVKIGSNDSERTIIEKIFSLADDTFIENPKFPAADRPEKYNIDVVLSGFLIGGGTAADRRLLVDHPVPEPVLAFLQSTHLPVVRILRSDAPTDAASATKTAASAPQP